MGNGAVTLQIQIVAEVLGISPEFIECITADTDTTPWNLGDYASRGTFVSGNAAKKVAESVKRELIKEASMLLKEAEENLIIKDNCVYLKDKALKKATLCEVMIYAQKISQREIICAETFAANAGVSSYGAHFAEVEVDTETGIVKVLNYVAAHDVGKAINPMSLEGQMEGAIQMGIGYALTEGLEIDDKGKITNSSLKRYHLINAIEMPKIKVILVEEGEKSGPFGAKSIGECSVVPVAPAVTNAVINALGCEFYDLPLKPNKILNNIKNNSTL
jgi:CO/xanthine dehydrogenase Mo-binding subunit